MTAVQATARGSGPYIVYVDGAEYSRHTAEREALENATEALAQDPGASVHYVHDYTVDVELVDAVANEPVEEEPAAEPEAAGVGLDRLEALAAEFAHRNVLALSGLDELTEQGWGQYEGNLDGAHTPGLPIDFRADEPTPSGDGHFARFVYEGLEDRWTGRYLWRSVGGASRLAFGCVLRANFPSNRVDGRSWKKGVGFPATTSNDGWAGMAPPGVGTLDEHRTEEQRTQVDMYQITLPNETLYPHVNLDLVAPVEHGQWYSFEMDIDLAAGRAKAWWNGTLYIDDEVTPGDVFDRVKAPMITLGGGSGLGPLTADDYIDVDACVVYYT